MESNEGKMRLLCQCGHKDALFKELEARYAEIKKIKKWQVWKILQLLRLTKWIQQYKVLNSMSCLEFKRFVVKQDD